MSTYDWSQTSDPLALQPGTYAVEITACEEKTSSNGNKMWVLTLKATDYNSKLCNDNFMLPPSNGANISKGKLLALGFAEADLNTLEPGHLLGKRTWVTVKSEPYKDRNGVDRTALRVDIAAVGAKCGFWAEKPGQITEPSIPF